MNGNFKKLSGKYILCLIFIAFGTFMAIRFSLWGIGELQSNYISSAVFCFFFAALGLIFSSFSIFIFNFNRNAYFKIESNKIDAKFSWGQEIHANLEDIKHVEQKRKNLKIFIRNNIVDIYNLDNAKDLFEYILSRIQIGKIYANLEIAKAHHKKIKKSFAFYLILTSIASILLFAHIGWCIFLTEGKDLVNFPKSEDFIFLAFCFAEAFTVISAFFFANKCGKKLSILNISKTGILSCIATESKTYGLDEYSNIISIKYFDHNTYRIIIFSPKEDCFAYMLERFDSKYLSWKICYNVAPTFEFLDDLYEDLDNRFEDVLFESE